MKKICMFFIMLLMAASAFAINLTEAEQALSKNQLKKANEIATMYLGEHPDSARAHMIRSYANAGLGDYGLAETEFQTAARLDRNGSVVDSPLAWKVYALVSTDRAARLKKYAWYTINGQWNAVDSKPRREPETIAPTREFSVPASEMEHPKPVQERLAHSTPRHEPVAHVEQPVKVKELESPVDKESSGWGTFFLLLFLAIVGWYTFRYFVNKKEREKELQKRLKAEREEKEHREREKEKRFQSMLSDAEKANQPVPLFRHQMVPPPEPMIINPHILDPKPAQHPQQGMSAATAGVIGLAAGGALGALAVSAHQQHEEREKKLEKEKESNTSDFSSGNDSNPPMPVLMGDFAKSPESDSLDFFSGNDSDAVVPPREEARFEREPEPVRETYSAPVPSDTGFSGGYDGGGGGGDFSSGCE